MLQNFRYFLTISLLCALALSACKGGKGEDGPKEDGPKDDQKEVQSLEIVAEYVLNQELMGPGVNNVKPFGKLLNIAKNKIQIIRIENSTEGANLEAMKGGIACSEGTEIKPNDACYLYYKISAEQDGGKDLRTQVKITYKELPDGEEQSQSASFSGSIIWKNDLLPLVVGKATIGAATEANHYRWAVKLTNNSDQDINFTRNWFEYDGPDDAIDWDNEKLSCREGLQLKPGASCELALIVLTKKADLTITVKYWWKSQARVEKLDIKKIE